MPSRKTYEQGCELTDELVGRFKIFGSGVPQFAFPPNPKRRRTPERRPPRK